MTSPSKGAAGVTYTGLLSRDAAAAHLDIEFAAAQRGRALTVLLFEPDDLDRYLHLSGAAAVEGVLRGVASLLREHARRMDVSAVYTTRSFMTILSGTDEHGALLYAARVQEQLHSAQTIVSLPNVSIGIAGYSPDMQSPAELLRAAETAAAQARAAGGGRVRVAGRSALPSSPADDAAGTPLQLHEREAAAEMRAVNRELHQAVAAGEARFRAVVESIQEVVFAADIGGRWEFLNFAWTLITGMTVDQSLGKAMFDFLHPDDVAEVERAFGDVIEAAVPYYRHEGRWRTRSGSYRWIEMRLHSTLTDGVVTGASGVLLDVTERRRAEEAHRRSEAYFRALIEHSADVMCVLNPDGTVRYMSPAIEAELGYPPEAFIGRNAFEFVHEDDVHVAQEEMQRLLSDEANAADIDLRLRHRDGHYVLMELSGRNLLHESVVGAIIMSGRDATERRRTELAIRQSDEIAMRAEKMDAIARFAAGAAAAFAAELHELRQAAALLAPGDEAQDAATERMRAALARADALVQRLRAAGGQEPRTAAVVDSHELLTELLPAVRHGAGSGIEITAELAAAHSLVRADATHLRDAILALAAAACDRMSARGRLAIRTELRIVGGAATDMPELGPGAWLAIMVADSGPILDDVQLARAFEPFNGVTADASGIAAVHGMIRQGGGVMTVTSDAVAGTQFTIYLAAAAGPGSGAEMPLEVPLAEEVAVEGAAHVPHAHPVGAGKLERPL